MNKTGVGRIATQDAWFSPESRMANRARSSSAPSSPPAKALATGRFRPTDVVDEPDGTPLRLANCALRPTHSLVVSQIRYVALEQRNLGTICVRVWWSREGEDLAGRPLGEGWRLRSVTGKTAILSNGFLDISIALPADTAMQEAVLIQHADHSEIKLRTLAGMSSTRDRSDLQIGAPYSVEELRRHSPNAFCCAECGIELVHCSAFVNYAALPSEHWEELLDAWMCHQDQQVNEQIVARNQGFWPKENEIFVGSAHIIAPMTSVSHIEADTNRPVRFRLFVTVGRLTHIRLSQRTRLGSQYCATSATRTLARRLHALIRARIAFDCTSTPCD